MCSRFELNANSRQMAERFQLLVPPAMANRSEFRPTDQALVVGPEGGSLARWGMAVEWDKRPLINARAETLDSRPFFRRLLGNRVLVPATGWWEWRVEGSRKIKTRLAPAPPAPFALAGLMEDGAFVIVTCAAAPELAHVHDRMPVILAPEAEAAWTDPAIPFAELAGALAPRRGAYSEEAETPPPPAQGSLF